MTETSKIKVFILEDNLLRMPVFRRKLYNLLNSDFTIFHAINVKEAIEMYERFNGDFDIFFLDHDLGDEVYVDSDNEDTGYQFAKYLAAQGIDGLNKTVITHSLNVPGRKNICSCFEKCIEMPITNF